jgi:hypothetical protein
LLASGDKLEQKAKLRAYKVLVSQIRERVDPVPCPYCGWYQTNMIAQLRADWAPVWGMVGTLAAVLGGVTVGVALLYGLICLWQGLFAMPRDLVLSFPSRVFAIGGGVLLGGCLVLYLRAWLAAGIDFNGGNPSDRIDLGKMRALIHTDDNPIAGEHAIDQANIEIEAGLLAGAKSDTRWSVLFLFVAGLVCLSFTITQLPLLRTFTWSRTEGTVTFTRIGSEVRGRDTRYYWPEVGYDYFVDGTEFHGSRYGLKNDDSLFKSSAEAIVRRLTATPTITVYYDPAEPSESVLLRGLPFWLAICWSLFTFVGLTALGYAVFLLRTYHERMTVISSPKDLQPVNAWSGVRPDVPTSSGLNPQPDVDQRPFIGSGETECMGEGSTRP